MGDLTDKELKNLKPRAKLYKVTDRDGMHAAVTPTGVISFRYQYRVNGRQEVLTIGRYSAEAARQLTRPPDALEFGMDVSLAEARTLLARARRQVERGESPSKAKVEKRITSAEALTFGGWAEAYFKHKADPKSGAERLADSTLSMRRSVYDCAIAGELSKLKLGEVTPQRLKRLCDEVKEKRGLAVAVHVREVVLYRGQKLALAEFLPLNQQNWITCGNALRLDWLSVCPPTGTSVKLVGDDLFRMPLDQAQIDFENEGGETYICGNPPYAGKGKKKPEQIADLEALFTPHRVNHGYIDYVGGWFLKAAEYGLATTSDFAFVTTNSLCQGHQVPLLWPLLFGTGHHIAFAHTAFKWANLATHNAGVTVVIVGMSRRPTSIRRIFITDEGGILSSREVENINAYLIGGSSIIVEKRSSPISELSGMDLGNMPYDGGNLLLTAEELGRLQFDADHRIRFIRRIYGSQEFIYSQERYCLWIEDADLIEALAVPEIERRVNAVRAMRSKSTDAGGRAMAARAHQLREMRRSGHQTVVVPRTSSESRPYLPAGLIGADATVSSEAFALFGAPLWTLSVLASRTHLIWIATVCGQLETRYRYSNVLGWNTFPVPTLTDKMKADLTRCAERILLAREAHFPATIADLYDPDAMPADLREAHERNDEVLERIYIGRRFRNDTERLEKLFDLYTKMTTSATPKRAGRTAKGRAS